LELSATVDYLFGFDATADVVDDWMYQELTEAYVRDPEMREFFEKSNPWALHAIAERLLEAEQRGLWAEANPQSLEALRETLLATEALLELRSESSVVSKERGLAR
jgi:cobaltochelatase CobN